MSCGRGGFYRDQCVRCHEVVENFNYRNSSGAHGKAILAVKDLVLVDGAMTRRVSTKDQEEPA